MAQLPPGVYKVAHDLRPGDVVIGADDRQTTIWMTTLVFTEKAVLIEWLGGSPAEWLPDDQLLEVASGDPFNLTLVR